MTAREPSYEDVVASYAGFPRKGIDAKIHYIHHKKLYESDAFITLSAIKALVGRPGQSSFHDLRHKAQRLVSGSDAGEAGIKAVADAQLKPWKVSRIANNVAFSYADKLHTARTLCALMLGIVTAEYRPVQESLPPNISPDRLQQDLGLLTADIKQSGSDGKPGMSYEDIGSRIADMGLSEPQLASVALSELEPERVLRQLRGKAYDALAFDADMLFVCRTVSRTMYDAQAAN